MANTPNIIPPSIEGSQSQKHVTHNDALNILDMLVQGSVKSKAFTGAPAAVEGDRYLVPTGASGVWSTHALQIAGYYNGGWVYGIPREGWRFWIDDENLFYVYNGLAWVSDGAGGDATFNTLGVNTSADATNKLAVASSAILFNHIGTSVQVKLNKNASGNSASFLYQTGFSGRAEFGTIGADDFLFKVSADGSTWFDALKIKTNGRMANKSQSLGLTAAGSTQGTALALTKQINEITTTAASTGVILPASAEPGEIFYIANQGANTLNIYPATGEFINSLAVNTPITLAANTRMKLWATGTKWYTQ